MGGDVAAGVALELAEADGMNHDQSFDADQIEHMNSHLLMGILIGNAASMVMGFEGRLPPAAGWTAEKWEARATEMAMIIFELARRGEPIDFLPKP